MYTMSGFPLTDKLGREEVRDEHSGDEIQKLMSYSKLDEAEIDGGEGIEGTYICSKVDKQSVYRASSSLVGAPNHPLLNSLVIKLLKHIFKAIVI